jgi:predicted ATPase
VLTLAAEQGFLLLTHDAAVYEGSVRSANGDALIDQIRSALADALATGADLTHPLRLTRLACCLARPGRLDEGLEALTEALARIERTGERWWEAETHRLRGDLLLQRSPAALDQAERCYQRAIKRARQQSAKSLELRAATSLARLWRDQGKRAEARDLLSPVYRWFTEGFDTPDLKEANALLDELR